MNRVVLRYAETQHVANVALSVLSRYNLNACLIGSMASIIFGIDHRKPNVCELYKILLALYICNFLLIGC